MNAEWGARVTGAILVAGILWVAADSVPTVRETGWAWLGLPVGGIIGAAAAPRVARPVVRLVHDLPAATLIAGAAGLFVGLTAAALLTVPLSRLAGQAGTWLPLLLAVALGLGGMLLAASRDWRTSLLQQSTATPETDEQVLVDTSAIIDGRIADVANAGFLKAKFLIPRFVLDELRHIADSPDSMRRTRGRRGLDILNRLSNEIHHPVEVLDVDVRDVPEVDGKLVRLAVNLKIPIVTTDFNLNRVAEIQGVRVLNVNELAQALKPVALPGEVMDIRVVQAGKEPGQGVGFLDDGTMVVIENGDQLIGQDVLVTVSRMLQTSAGRIIFAQPSRD